VTDIHLDDDIGWRVDREVNMLPVADEGGALNIETAVGLRPLGGLYLLHRRGAKRPELDSQT